MKLLKQALAVLGTVVVIAVIAALVTPKTAHALVATFVQVVNTPSQPVPIANIYEPALNAFQDSCFAGFNKSNSATCNFQMVPAGKRLVIEDADVSLFINSGNRPIQVAFFTPMSLNGSFMNVGHHLTATFMGPLSNFGTDWFETHQSTRLYVDPSQTPSCVVELSATPTSNIFLFPQPGFFCNLSGHFVNAQ